ncbi:MAG: hypothetical protein NTW97_03330 [Candidatus Krumholzibacteria bacterium]|nr:hypothetical protein [Candidatus Krumholzibacteria bacterium]
MDRTIKRSPRKIVFSGKADRMAHALPCCRSKMTQESNKTSTVTCALKIAAGVALLAAGGLFISWTAHRVDRQMRAEIFLQAQMVAQAVDIRNVVALSGTEADLASRDYRRIKEQLTLIRQVAPKCRFIYLMGRSPDGKIFFFVDSEAAESADYSPPGQTYDEATKDDHQVFATGSGNMNGDPYKDRWGVWITALVPMLRPNTDRVLAVLGMDFNAETWKWDVATRTTLPAMPAAFLILLGVYILVFPCRVAWS